LEKVVSEKPDFSQIYRRWYRFKRNKAAIIGSIILVFLFLMVFLGEIVTTHDPVEQSIYINLPPQPIHIIRDGHLSRPFIYGLESTRDPENLEKIWTIDTNKVYYIQFFTMGDKEYRLFGFIPAKIRIMGVESEGRLSLLGTDQLGRDFFSRLMIGARLSLLLPLLGTLISSILGVIIGAISGYFGGIIDNLLQRILEIITSFPRIPVWIALSAAIPTRTPPLQVAIMIVLIFAAIGWAQLARQIRGKVLSLREEDYIMAAKSVGTSSARIILKHIIPNTLTHVIVVATISIPIFILAESALSFLGLGITPPLLSWGVLLHDTQSVHVIVKQPWLIWSGALITITMLAFSFVGDGLRDAFDPHLQ